MKLEKLFKDFDKTMTNRRIVSIYLNGDSVFTGMVSDIPDELKNKAVSSWCNMLEVNTLIQDNCCDEDVNSVNVEMLLTVFITD